MEITTGSDFMMNIANMENTKNTIQNAKNAESSHELKKASEDFEAIFLNMMFQAMWKTVPDSGLFEKNSTTKLYEGIIQSALSKDLAQKGGLGIGKMLYDQLVKR